MPSLVFLRKLKTLQCGIVCLCLFSLILFHVFSDEIRGQVVKATIVLAKEYKARTGEELVKELQNHVKKVTAPYKYPRVIEFVDELPKTISGKIRRVEIRENDRK